MQITLKLRLRDKHGPGLSRQARAVNVVFNFCSETQRQAAQARRKWLSVYDLMKLTAGTGTELDLHARTIQRVFCAYDEGRKAQKKPWLRWRGRKSLGWVPVNTGHVVFDGAAFVFPGVRYEAVHLRDVLKPGMRFGAGSFNADAKGCWYVNLPVAVECRDPRPENAVGIDLGLKALATLSTGDRIEMARFYRASEYRASEAALSVAQRARKTTRARAIQAKARNRRRDFLHKAGTALCAEYGTIVVGDVSPSKLAMTPMAKSVYDAGWTGFREQLRYKSMRTGRRYLDVSEAMSSQTCSTCGSREAPSRPRGIAGLGKRSRRCDGCGTLHDRDHNAALDILRVGLDTLAAGAPNAG